jgi:hypothetical protein
VSVALNNVTTADRYTDANTLICPGAVVVNVTVTNAAAYLQWGVGQPQPIWEQEEFQVPIVGSFDRVCDGVRVRSGKAGVPAKVTITAKNAQEAGQGGR